MPIAVDANLFTAPMLPDSADPGIVDLTPFDLVPNIRAMDQELEQLFDRTQRLMEIARRLADENASLRGELEAIRQTQAQLQGRMTEARSRVETALARLPLSMGEDD